MATQLATQEPTRKTRFTSQELLADFGEEYLSIQSLFQFCFVPGGRLNLLKELTLEEEWGINNFVLLKYLAVHIRLAIEQGIDRARSINFGDALNRDRLRNNRIVLACGTMVLALGVLGVLFSSS